MKFTILVALLYLFSNGVQNDDPVETFQYKDTFPTARACEAFRKSPELQDELAKLAEYLSAQLAGKQFAIETECVTVEGRSASE